MSLTATVPSQSHASAAETTSGEEYLTLNVRFPDGTRRACLAADGFKLVELLRADAVPIKAECGGACVCATCHVRVSGAWGEKLPAASDEELDKLDEIPDADEASRLACQIEMSPELDGLEIEIRPDSLAEPHLVAAE